MALAAQFELAKHWLIDGSGLAKDALHIHIGMLLFIVTLLLWRGRGRWLAAWAVALLAAVGGEGLDIIAERGRSTIQPDTAHWHDIWNTMLWPTVLLAISRWLPAAPRPAPSGEDGE